ncbi:glycoside hydrolase family 16 protein [Pseudohyphozyma bogoriensis]|nr:glycoside hydrolase family 16 protein [Pseudohyphozyma bogoriensis]
MMTRFVATGRFKREAPWMRFVVSATFALNLLHLGLMCSIVCYWASVQGKTDLWFLKGTYMNATSPLTIGLIAVMVQGVYGWRAWSLLEGIWQKRLLVAVLAPTMFAACFAAVLTSVLEYGSWATVDMGLSITLWLLFRSKVVGFNLQMDSVLTRLGVLAIQSDSMSGTPEFNARVAALKQEVHDAIPAEYKLPASILDAPPINVMGVPASCGILTPEELAITELDTVAVCEKIASGALTSVAVVTAFGKRAAIAHQLTNCLTEYFIDEALERAKELDEHFAKTGKVVGPLHGIPIAIDIMALKGHKMSNGYLATLKISEHDSDQVAILRAAGAVFHCKTTQPQGAMHIECSSFWGTTTNPYNRYLSPGGSTGGTAALLAMRGALVCPGGDIGGSIRGPCAQSGLYGMRATSHTLPYGGAGWDGIATSTGPMCNSWRDMELFMRVLLDAKPELVDPLIFPTKLAIPDLNKTKIKVGIMYHDAHVMPHPPILREPLHTLTEFALSPPVKDHTAGEITELLGRRNAFRREYLSHWVSQGIDVLLCPAYQGTAAPHNTGRYIGLMDFPGAVFPTNLSVDPKLDLPLKDFNPMSEYDAVNTGYYDAELMAGSPICLQVVAPRFQDSFLLGATKLIEEIVRAFGREGSTYSMRRDNSQQGLLDATSLGVLSGAVGGSFGPFPRSSTYSNYGTGGGPFNRRDSMASSDVAIDVANTASLPFVGSPSHRYSTYSNDSYAYGNEDGYEKRGPSAGGVDESLLWDASKPESDDYLHNPDPEVERMLDRQWQAWSLRGWLNMGLLIVIIVVLVGLFAGWPIYHYVIQAALSNSNSLGYNLGGINGSGQVPATGLPSLVDSDTPTDAYTRTGFDGETYNLVFSDEFNTDGRTFWHGKLVITMDEQPSHGLNFRSGMIQSWNKFCFTGGYIEVSMSMPGDAKAQGFWPGAWTMGNLGRAGYGATNDGMWPYSYDSCDVGTLPNQTFPNGTTPSAAKTSGSSDYGGELSWLGGQRASACTCEGEDHPGPNVGVGRGAPELDIIEAQVDSRGIGSASQSLQLAPFDSGYEWKNSTPYIQVWNDSITFQNVWEGAVYQEEASFTTLTDTTSYNGNGYTSFGIEYDPGPDGRITWAMNASQTWQINADAIGPNNETMIAQRLISVEPMYINLNLAISDSFQTPAWGSLTFPNKLYIDYVRVYQKGTANIGCDPKDYPTSDYINKHLDVYDNLEKTPSSTVTPASGVAAAAAHGHHGAAHDELRRGFGYLSALGVGFSLLNSWTAMSASFSLVLPSGGAVSMVWGGQYDWSYALAPSRYRVGFSYFTGWFSTAGWVALAASGSSLCANFLFDVVSLWYGDFELQPYQTFLVYLAFTIFALALNLFGVKLLPYLDKGGLYWSLAGFAIVSITLLSCQSGDYQPRSFVFGTWINTTGWPTGIAFILGLLQSTFGLCGFDAVTHLIEEMPNPAVAAPRVMVLAVLMGAATSWLFVIIVLFCMTNIDDVISAAQGPLLTIYYQATKSRAGATCLLVFNLGSQFIACQGLMTVSSRMTMAFARDRGFGHLSPYLSRVHPGLQVPVWSVLFTATWTAIFGLIFLGSSVALNAIISASIVLLQVSYTIPMILVLVRGNAVLEPEGAPQRTLKLGIWRVPINIAALIFATVTNVFFVFPPSLPVTPSNMNYVIVVVAVVVLLSGITWVVDARKNFHGPAAMEQRILQSERAAQMVKHEE